MCLMMTIALQIEGLRGIDGCFQHGMRVSDFGKQFSWIAGGEKIYLIYTHFPVGSHSVEQKVSSLHRTIQHHSSNALSLTALLKHRLRDQLIVWVVS